ncbi:barstar family protein [Kitasatospora sp. NPDC048540]|uniref:barstar family protein n=1 Tax=unclassified Kitasatospora TaxID=2633591 RepID=UPI00068CC2F7|nr:barstar family protein [Kitasatospora sp. MBT63]
MPDHATTPAHPGDLPVYRLPGAGVTDPAAFWTALGRAVGAPGGYYGRNLDALADCLRGGYGPVPPYVLEWEDAQVARRRLAGWPGAARDGGPSYFEAIVAVLEEGGVTVLLR